MSNLSYEYDQYNRLTEIKLNNVNEVSYTLNAKDQRTAATYANAGLWNFTYDQVIEGDQSHPKPSCCSQKENKANNCVYFYFYY